MSAVPCDQSSTRGVLQFDGTCSTSVKENESNNGSSSSSTRGTKNDCIYPPPPPPRAIDHNSNMMLDRVTGRVVHIDFGDCFEVAMQRDKFPEKVPFRLTRMLVNAMEVSMIDRYRKEQG